MGVNQDYSQGTWVSCGPISQLECFLISAPKAALGIHHRSHVHGTILLLAWELLKARARTLDLWISSISLVPGTEMAQIIINKSKCLFNTLLEQVRKISCLHLGQQQHYLSPSRLDFLI